MSIEKVKKKTGMEKERINHRWGKGFDIAEV
jgi:hypothetical protein